MPMPKELLQEPKDTWKKVLNFIVEMIKLIIAAFLGSSGAGLV